MEETKLLTAKDVMRILQLGRNSVYEMLQLGIIKSVKVGSSYRVKEEDLQDYLERNKVTKH